MRIERVVSYYMSVLFTNKYLSKIVRTLWIRNLNFNDGRQVNVG